jgi:hypothetical protein
MELLINGEKLDVPAGTSFVMLQPMESGDGYIVSSMTILGPFTDEKAALTLTHMARGLAWLAEEDIETVMDAGRSALDYDLEYPARILLAEGLTLEDIEPDGSC